MAPKRPRSSDWGREQQCLPQVAPDAEKRTVSVEALNRNLSASLLSVQQRLAGTERNLEELLAKHRNLLKNFSNSANKVCTECANGKNYKGKCYFSSTEKMTWIQSRDYCKSKGAHLVIIHSKEEQVKPDVVLSIIEETQWIGLSDRETEGTWRWVDNTLLSQTKTT
ncbi:C-type lectin domain family 4 member E-like [Megalops cyprinoides]|uniref:C-type lectin domain family 4 member E-like n=1 Tax=Megalops cyprinoides TaxID=118141 RepID=UPI00186541CB|nr:C-type lectin domain family 4 member E-like [Megalops cyprinoides]